MKHIKIVLSLIAASVLSTPALADHGEDPVLTSFERDMHHELSSRISQPALEEVDPLTEAIAAALEGYCGPKARAVSSASLQPSRAQTGRAGG